MMRFLKFFPFNPHAFWLQALEANSNKNQIAIVFLWILPRLHYFILKIKIQIFLRIQDYLFIHLLLFLNNFQVTAYSPTSRPLGCPVSEENGTFYASFQPEEAGEWKIHVTYDGQDIEHSPFKCMVFNPRAIFVSISDFRVPLLCSAM